MSERVFYQQCRLQRGETQQTAWLPEKFAVAEMVLELKDAEGAWVNGWQVTGVGDVKMDGSVLSERSRDYLNTRKASDA